MLNRGRMVGRIPVIDTPDRQQLLADCAPEAVPACTACGYGDRNGVVRVRHVVGGIDMMLCLDYLACCQRYRRACGSPEQYGAFLAGRR